MIAKRLIDTLVAACALVVLSPVIAVTAVLVRIKLGSPVLFRQERPGLGARPFMLVKFRTMTDARDASGELLPDAERLPRFGRTLRATSLDELPQLWNVVRGEMSLVGPRPLLMRYLDRYTQRQARRHEVRPGITGWAQVHGRNLLNWPDRLEYDVWYVEHRSLWLDVKIVWMTFARVFAQSGVAADGEATMREFAPTDTDSSTSTDTKDRT